MKKKRTAVVKEILQVGYEELDICMASTPCHAAYRTPGKEFQHTVFVIVNGKAQILLAGRGGSGHEATKQANEKLSAMGRRVRLLEPARAEVLLLEEEDGSWIALCRADAKQREVGGATIADTQAALRAQWANPLPLRFPEDFPLSDHDFEEMRNHGKLVEVDDQFAWYVLDVAARERAFHAALDLGEDDEEREDE